jgi:dihydrofolate reductase
MTDMSRKIILNVAISIDSMIEGPNGEYDWCFTDQDYGMKKFIKSIDAIFYGRKSYELVQSIAENPWAKLKSYVFSNTMKAHEEYELVSGDIIGKVKAIKAMPGKKIWLFGGAELTTALMNANLVDELQLAVHPIILGRGKAMFQNLPGRVKTKLVSSETFESGLVMLNYEVLS